MSQAEKVNIYLAYTQADEALKQALEQHLIMLQRAGLVEMWNDQKIDFGQDLGVKIDGFIQQADIILLLISSDFLASDFDFEVEMKTALQRNEEGKAYVVPVILRDCLWELGSLGQLSVLPPNGEPITSDAWRNQDAAFKQVALGIQKLVLQIRATRQEANVLPHIQRQAQVVSMPTATTRDEKAVLLLNQLMEILTIPNFEESAKAAQTIFHQSLLERNQLKSNVKNYSYRAAYKARNETDNYVVPVEITRIQVQKSNLLGEERGLKVKYWIAKRRGSPTPMGLFFPENEGSPKMYMVNY